MIELFKETRWDELFAFFQKGTPPLIFQILALNTIVFMVFLVRRMRGAKTLRAETASTVQSILLFTNMLAIFQDNLLESLKWFY